MVSEEEMVNAVRETKLAVLTSIAKQTEQTNYALTPANLRDLAEAYALVTGKLAQKTN